MSQTAMIYEQEHPVEGLHLTTEPPSVELELLAPGEPIPAGATEKPSPWVAFRAEAERLKTVAETLTVTRIDDRAGMKLARETRLALRQVRIAVEKKHEETKAFFLEGGRKVDKAKNELVALISPLEKRLEAQEQFDILEAARIEAETRVARTSEIAPFLDGPLAVDLGKITPEQYAEMLRNAQDLRGLRLKREEEARAAAEQARLAEESEREKLRLENEELKRQAAAREAAATAEFERLKALQKDRVDIMRTFRADAYGFDWTSFTEEEFAAKAAEQHRLNLEAVAEREAVRAEQAKAAAALSEEKRKAEQERDAAKLISDAAAAKAKAALKAQQKAAAEKQAAIEEAGRLEREKLKAEIDAREAEHEKARLENQRLMQKAEQERKAREDAESKRIADEKEAARLKAEDARIAAAAPDVEKIKAWAGAISAMAPPVLNDADVTEELRQKHSSYVKWVLRTGSTLEGRATV